MTIQSPKSNLVALILCIFLGVIGVHRFYVGKAGTGVLFFLTLGAGFVWWIIDIIMIITESFTDKSGAFLKWSK
ncbi:TM2 domain-containing protein [Mycoplasma sp. AC1221]